MRNLLEPLKEGRVRLLLNAGDHASMQASLKKCLEGMGIDFKVTLHTSACRTACQFRAFQSKPIDVPACFVFSIGDAVALDSSRVFAGGVASHIIPLVSLGSHIGKTPINAVAGFAFCFKKNDILGGRLLEVDLDQ